MKKALMVLLCVSLLFSCKQQRKERITDDRPYTFEVISEMFSDPPSEYRTIPFWVWNEKITREMIDDQLPGFKKNGFGGVFVHPRYGLITEYASDEWYELVEYAMEKAKSMDMELWLYDENSFPSGFAGGRLPAIMPVSYENGIAMKTHEMDVFQPDSSKSWISYYRKSGSGYTNITNNYKEHFGRKGDYIAIEKLFYEPSKWFGGFTYTDLIYPGVTEKFIEITMTGYERTIGDEFGSVVPGVFTDEPNINPRFKGTTRWTPDLFEKFRSRWGYDLEDELVSLFMETGEWKRVRHNYYCILLELFIERWSVPWNEYTEEKGLKWTGHYWEHGWPNPIHGGDNMAMYPYHQIPAIDMLFNSFKDRPDQFGNVRAVKELSSVANQFGRSRALSETYGASGYELSFEDMKRNGDWEYALGVNFMNQHLSYGSMLGDRKHDFPQTFSYHTPWWDDYRGQADYFARLSLALASGYQENDILVIEPTTSAWMHFVPGAENNVLNEIGDEFHLFLDKFEYQKLEYDLASEKTLRDSGKVENGKIGIGQRMYSSLVLPYGLKNLDRSSFEYISQYLEEGGILYSFCGIPAYIDGRKSGETQELFGGYKEQVVYESDPGESGLNEISRSKEVIFTPLKNAEKVYFMRRKLNKGEIIFLSNFDKGKKKSFLLAVENMRNAIEMDPVSGKFFEVNVERKSNKVFLQVELADAGSKLYFFSPGRIKARLTEKKRWESDTEEEIFISGIRREQPNVIALDYCYLDVPSGAYTGDELMYFYDAHDLIYQEHGFPDNPWVSSSQFKTEIIDRDTFGMNSGFIVTFPLFINEGTDMSSVELVVERPDLYKVTVNEIEFQRIDDRYYVDKGTGVYAVGKALRVGNNNISLTARPFSVFHELAPVFLTGNFSVQPAAEGWQLSQEQPLSTGSWKAFGLPFYPGKISYHSSFTMEGPLKAKLKMENWEASCITVSVNDSEDMLLWPPYEKDLSKWLVKGENTLKITLTGSLKNLNGPHHNVNRKGIVTPWSFKYAPEKMPSGEQYDLVDYGLFSVPRLLLKD